MDCYLVDYFDKKPTNICYLGKGGKFQIKLWVRKEGKDEKWSGGEGVGVQSAKH